MKACVDPQSRYFYDTPKQNHVRALDQSLSIRPRISVSFSLCPYRSVIAPHEIGRMTCARPHSPIVSSHWDARAVTTRQENKLLRQCCKHRRKTGKGQQCTIAQELQTGRRTHAKHDRNPTASVVRRPRNKVSARNHASKSPVTDYMKRNTLQGQSKINKEKRVASSW